MITTQPYEISNEYNITELLNHFDSNYIFDIINDKLEKLDFASILEDPNVVVSFEETFKMMNDNFPGDSNNIKYIRDQVYTDIINILCQKFNLRFDQENDNIDRYTLAFYMYDFLVCNRNKYIVNFFTSFIINNKASLIRIFNLDEFKKSKDSSLAYNKMIYSDSDYSIISANVPKIIKHIATLDISLYNIWQSIYINQEVLYFLDNAIADKGQFFKDFYCNLIDRQDIMPILVTNIRLELQRLVGDISQSNIQEFMSYGGTSNE